MTVSVSGTIDQKTYLKKFRGGFSPLSPPLDPPMSLNPMQWSKCLYCSNRTELWLWISFQAISVYFDGTLATTRGTSVEKPCPNLI